MGELIDLPTRRAERDRRSLDLPPTFFFDVSDPLSYLTAERVERFLGDVAWVAVDGTVLSGPARERGQLREHAESCARQLRLPLVWPDAFPAGTPCALRAAAYACELGAGAQFALAASRLAFCGGFDLEHPEALAEAAAAAGIQPELSLAAAADPTYDLELEATARRLRAAGVCELPAICSDGEWLDGEAAVAEAMALRHAVRLGRG
jgi:2-hydroxychromene-2-carboxylate isomerase